MEEEKEEVKEEVNVAYNFFEYLDYFERRITMLNRRACLHEGAPCGIRARQEITGMLCVLNAIGYEAVGDWTRYDCEFVLVPAAEVAAKKGASK